MTCRDEEPGPEQEVFKAKLLGTRVLSNILRHVRPFEAFFSLVNTAHLGGNRMHMVHMYEFPLSTIEKSYFVEVTCVSMYLFHECVNMRPHLHSS